MTRSLTLSTYIHTDIMLAGILKKTLLTLFEDLTCSSIQGTLQGSADCNRYFLKLSF